MSHIHPHPAIENEPGLRGEGVANMHQILSMRVELAIKWHHLGGLFAMSRPFSSLRCE